MDDATLALRITEALLSSGPWGLALAVTLWTVSRGVATASEHLCELFPRMLGILDRLVDKGLEVRLKTYHYTDTADADDEK
jgi:hypothetical protein